MSKGCRSLIQTLATVLVVACDADILAPNRPASTSLLAERVTGSGLSTWPVSPSMIGLSWPDGVPNEAGWEIHRSTSGATGSFTLRASPPANTTSFTDSTLVTLTEYCYKVRSFRNNGSKKSVGAFSNVSCSTTLGPPAAPSSVNAVPRASRTIDITWVDNANDAANGEQGFRVDRAGSAAGPWTTIANLGPNVVLFADGNGITPEQQVCYRVIAINPYGESPSNTDCTATPQAPSGMSATSSDAQSIDVSWVDLSNVEDGYEVQRRLSDGVWQVLANLSANANSFHDAAIESDAVYQYRVRAKRDGGFSDFSVVVTIAAASRPPDAPVLRSVSPAGSTVAKVSWDESPLATQFRVERSTNGQLTWLTAAMVSPGNGGLNDGGLTPEQEVCYRVIAHNALGDSPPSNIDCTKPPAAPTNLAITPDGGGGYSVVTWTDNSNIEEGYDVLTYSCVEDFTWCSDTYSTTYASNTTSIFIGYDIHGRQEYIEAVYAVYDGGRSDPASWASSAGTAVMSGTAAMSGTRATRVLRGAVIRRPPVLPRQLKVTDKLPSTRKAP